MILHGLVSIPNSCDNLPPSSGGFLFIVLYIICMSTSVPDGISFSDLEKLAKQASEETSSPKGPYDGLDKDELVELVEAIVDATHEKCGHPMVAKVMIIDIVTRLLNWHSKSGIDASKEGETIAGMMWHRDAGKLQSILCLIDSISMGPDDFDPEV